MATTLEELEIKFKASFGDLETKMNQMKNQMTGIEKAASRTQSAFSKLGSLAKTFLAVHVGKAMIGVGKESLSMANEVVESENLFAESMGKMSKSARDWSDGLRDSLGLNAFALRKNAGTMNVMLQSMGMSEKKAYDMATALTELSEDMASFYNMSSEDMFAKLQSGMTGQSMPLKQIGILIDDHTLKQYAAAAGIEKTTGELSQQEKVLARYAAIMAQTSASQGDLARTIDSPANQLRVLANTVDQAKIAFGKAMQTIQALAMPVLSRLASAAMTAAQAIAYLMGGIGGLKTGNVATALTTKKGAAATENLAAGLSKTADAYKKAGGAARKAAKDTSVGLKAFDEINKITDTAAQSGGGGGGGKIDEIEVPDTSGTTSFLDDLETISEKVRELAEKIRNVVSILEPALAGLAAGFIAFQLTGNPALALVVAALGTGVAALIKYADDLKKARIDKAFGTVTISMEEAATIVSNNLTTKTSTMLASIRGMKSDTDKALQQYAEAATYTKKVTMMLSLITMTTGEDQFNTTLEELVTSLEGAGAEVRTTVTDYLDVLHKSGKINIADYLKRRDELQTRIENLDKMAKNLKAAVTAQVDAALVDGEVDETEKEAIRKSLQTEADKVIAGWKALGIELKAQVDADLKAGLITKDGAAAQKADIESMVSGKVAELGVAAVDISAEIGTINWTEKTLTEDQLAALEEALNNEVKAARDLVLTAEVQVTASASTLLGEGYEGSATQAALSGLFSDVQATIDAEAENLKTLFAQAHEFGMTEELMSSIQTSIETSRQAAEMIANNGLNSEGAWLKARKKGEQLSAESVDNLVTAYNTYVAAQEGQLNETAESVINGIYSAMANGSVSETDGMASIKEIEDGLIAQVSDMKSGAIIDTAKTVMPSIQQAISSGELNATDIEKYRDQVLQIFEGVDYSSLSTEAQTAMTDMIAVFAGSVGVNGEMQEILQSGGYELLSIGQQAMWALSDELRKGAITPEEMRMILVDPSKPALEDLKDKLGKGASSAIYEYLDEWIKKAPEADKAGRELAEAGKEGAESVDFTTIGKEQGADLGEGLLSSTKSGAEGVDLKSTGKKKGSELSADLDNKSNTTKATSAGKAVISAADTGAAGVDLEPTGAAAGADLASGVDKTENITAATKAGKALPEAVIKGVESAPVKPAGEKGGKDYVSGIKSENAQATAAGKTLAANVKSGAESVSLYTVGQNAAQGFRRGLDSAIADVRAAAARLARAAKETMQIVLVIRSPSKEFGWIGEMTARGFTDALTDAVPGVREAADRLGTAAIDGMKIDSSSLGAIDYNGNIDLAADISGVIEMGIARGVQSVMDALNISINVDGQTFGRVAISGINQAQRAAGTPLLEM